MRVLLLLLACLPACDTPGEPGPDDTPGVDDPARPPATCASGLTTAALESGTWDERFTVAGFAGHDGLAPTVYDFAVDADGSLLATGRFQWLGAERIEPLARWRDGAWEPARAQWEIVPDLDGFAAIAISPEGHLALATYDSYGDRAGELWVDDGTGLRVVGAFEGLVRGLAWFDGRLWAAGHGTIEGIGGLATWDGATWSAAPGGALNGSAFELTLDGGELLVGGAFDAVGGVSAANVAAFDGEAWRALDLPDALAVYALTRGEDGELYAGGAITDILAGAGGVARWDGAAWQLVGEGLSIYGWPGVVTDLVSHDGELHATGCFNAVNDPEGGAETSPARALARWDGAAWNAVDDDGAPALGPWMEPGVCGDEGLTAVWDVSYQRLASTPDGLFLAGSFPGAGGVLSQSIVGHDGDGWVAQGAAGLGLGGWTDRVAAAGEDCGDVYVLGTFTHAGGAPTGASLLRFADGWQPIADDIPVDAWCPALAGSPTGEAAVGCMEFPADGDAVGRVYRVVGDALEPVATLDLVHYLTYDADGVLWIGGGGATGYLARLDGDALTVVEDGFDAPVTRVDVWSQDDIVVAGMFSSVGDVTAARIARWDGTAWSPLGDGAPGMVTALARDATHIYASTYDEGAGAFLLGAWDGSTWTELASPGSGLTPQPYFNLDHIEPLDDGLLVVGAAWLDDGEGRGALVYRDGTFGALGGGARGITVSDLQVTGGGVWVAGSLAEVGAGDTLAPSVGVARFAVGR